MQGSEAGSLPSKTWQPVAPAVQRGVYQSRPLAEEHVSQVARKGVQDRWTSDKVQWQSLEEYVLFLKQKKAYHYASDFCHNGLVLDFGCGSGYGTALLAGVAEHVLGVDMSA